MTWLAVIGLALAAFAVLALLAKSARGAWEAIGAALLLGVAGYAWQGSPRQPGAPKPPVEKIAGRAAEAVAERQALAKGDPTAGDPMADKHVVIADALARHGQFADAAEVLRGAVERDPDNAEAWLAMANALVGHAEGNLSPAALYAYGQAARVAPDSPGPPFFMGMALLRAGRLAEGRAVWAELLARTPPGAPWRADLAGRLAELNAFLARPRQTGR
ncbi:MAG TPA: tetratricopeptide repeat protein [Novosphingobium sp.]